MRNGGINVPMHLPGPKSAKSESKLFALFRRNGIGLGFDLAIVNVWFSGLFSLSINLFGLWPISMAFFDGTNIFCLKIFIPNNILNYWSLETCCWFSLVPMNYYWLNCLTNARLGGGKKEYSAENLNCCLFVWGPYGPKVVVEMEEEGYWGEKHIKILCHH